IRVPFVDLDLLRKLAPMLAQPHPLTKRDVVDSLSSKLPTPILNRPKTGFSIPVREWLLEESLKEKVESRNAGDRGLRGWAKEVYRRFPVAQLAEPTQRRTTEDRRSKIED